MRCPYRRAGNTRVSLTTTRSPGVSRSGRSRVCAPVIVPLTRCTIIRRDDPRSDTGCWAISSAGRSKSKSATRTSDRSGWGARSVHLHLRRGAQRLPVFGGDCPQHLIEVVVVPPQRLPEHRFLDRAQLAECTVAAAIGRRRACLESQHAERVEYPVDDQGRRRVEQALAPELHSECKPPLRPFALRLDRANLEQAHRLLVSRRYHGQADRLAGGALASRTGDERLESLEGVRWRRDE